MARVPCNGTITELTEMKTTDISSGIVDISLKKLEMRIRVLKKRNGNLKMQLEKQQMCKNCIEFRKERDFLFRKCKNYESQIEENVKKHAEQGNLLKESQQENIRLNKVVCDLEEKITEKNILLDEFKMKHLEAMKGINAVEESNLNVNPQKTPVFSSRSCISYVTDENLILENLEIKEEPKEDLNALYQLCRDVTDETDNTEQLVVFPVPVPVPVPKEKCSDLLENVNSDFVNKREILEIIEKFGAESDENETRDFQCSVINRDAESDSETELEQNHEEQDDNAETNADNDGDAQTCKWIVHDEGNLLRMKTCGRVVTDAKDLSSHVMDDHVFPAKYNKAHYGAGAKQPHSGYICYWHGCKRNGVPFKARKDFAGHFRTHSGEKPYRCPYVGCGKTFAHKSSVRLHEGSHTGKRVSCPYPGCYKMFSHKSSMVTHHRVMHTGRPGSKCAVPGCGKVFHSASALGKHALRHVVEKSHPCRFPGCAQTFAYKAARDNHFVKHTTASKVYECSVEWCRRRFVNARTFQEHYRTHVGDV